MKKLLFDINILLDIFLNRKNFVDSSSAVFQLVESKKIKGFLTTHGFATVYYLLEKESSKKTAQETIRKLRLVLDVAEISKKNIDLSLNSDFPDFEDAIQYYAALELSIDLILTRNKADFRKSQIQIATPEEFLSLIS